MSERGHGPPSNESRSTQPPGMMRQGSYPMSHVIDPRHPESEDVKPAAQSTELERLVSDNKRLAGTLVALRQDLVTTQHDIQKLRAHIGSIQTESDIQIRIFLDKMAKMEVHIRAGENVKKDHQKAHSEARALVASREELISQVEQATKDLEKVLADVEKLPEMEAELDELKQEHQRLRLTFEHEKGKNMKKVAQMEFMEKDLVGMAREVERLRAEVSNAEKRANAPNVYSGPYMNQEQYPPPPHMHASNGPYVDGYGNHRHVQMGAGEGMIPYGGTHPRPTVPGANPSWKPPPQMTPYGGPHLGPPPSGGNPQWRLPPPSHDQGAQMNLRGPVRNRKKGPPRQEKRENNSIIICNTNTHI